MNRYRISHLATKCRSQWGVSLTNPIDIISIALHKIENTTLVFLPMPHEVNGACFKYEDERLIFVNFKHPQIRQRFTIAHEIYHLLFGREDFNFYGMSDNDEESEANLFAQYLLFPLIMQETVGEFDLRKIIETEQYYKIPHEEFIQTDLIKRNDDVGDMAASYGFDRQLYEPYTDCEITMGHYVQLSNDLEENDLISKSLKEEYLIDAYCSGLVFDEFDEGD